ncbi:hypothetical protein Pfo_001393 [Paulownia fortunei]|nr:hypothetical protein Pfo_001393 [Paulownia fortunei]
MSGESPFNAHPKRHGYRGCNVNRRRKGAARDHHIPLANVSSEARGQKLISTPPLLQILKYMVPSVLALVTLKYQGKTESLFVENPVPVWCFLAATYVYWLIVEVMKQMTTRNRKFFQMLSRAALVSGVLSAVSLVSFFLPYPISLLPLITWTPLPVVLGWPIFYNAYSLLHTGITSVINNIRAKVVWARGFNLTEEASLPV